MAYGHFGTTWDNLGPTVSLVLAVLSTSETCCPKTKRLISSTRTSETLCPVVFWDKLSSQSRAPCCPVIDGTKRLISSMRTSETLCPLKVGTSISGRLICLNRQGQGCRNGLTVFLQRRHRLPEHSTRRKIDNAAPYAPAVHRLPCRSAAAMRPRRTARLCRALHGGSPLRFSVLSGQGETLSNLGPVSLPSFQLWTCMFSASFCVRLMRLPPRRWQ